MLCELSDLIVEHGKPGMIVSDNGTELTSNAVIAWCGEVGVEWHYVAPGKPMENRYVESLTGRMRNKAARLSSTLVKTWREGSHQQNCNLKYSIIIEKNSSQKIVT